jgi:hypothetical protein
MSERSSLLPARCSGCESRSEPRPLGQTPDGWARGRSAPGDSTQARYWCPECCKLAGFEAE